MYAYRLSPTRNNLAQNAFTAVNIRSNSYLESKQKKKEKPRRFIFFLPGNINLRRNGRLDK